MSENVISMKQEKLKRRRALVKQAAKSKYRKMIQAVMENEGVTETEAKEVLRRVATDRIISEEFEKNG